MEKRLLSLNLAILLLLTLLVPPAAAAERTVIASGTGRDNLTWTLYNDGEMVISGSGAMDDYTIESIPWRNYCTRIQTVTIQSGVTRIGHYAFASAINLSLIRLSDSVESLGSDIFWACSRLNSITVDEGNTSFSAMGGVLFNRDGTKLILCPGGKGGTYSIPDGVEEIGANAFDECGQLTGITLSASVKEIDPSAFAECVSLRSISVASASTTYAAENGVLFSKDKTTLVYCPHNKSGGYTVPEGVTTIDSGAFSGNSGLTRIEFPGSVTSIGDRAFYNCTQLSSVILPDGLVSIGDEAFCNCPVSQIEIPASVREIGAYAFRGCKTLKLIIFRGNAPQTGSYPFSGMSGNVFYPEGDATWTRDVWNSFGGSMNWNSYRGINDIVVASGTCGSNLTWKLSIAGELSISGTGSMTDYSYSRAPWFGQGVTILSVKIGEGVTSIGVRAFDNCREIASIELPESLTSIGREAFSTCANLQLIRIPAGVTEIGAWAFDSCDALKQIEFLGNAPSFGSGAFGGVSATAYYPEGDVTWTEEARKNYGGRLTWTAFHVCAFAAPEFFWTEEPISATAKLTCSCGLDKTVDCAVKLSAGEDGRLYAVATAVSGKSTFTGQNAVPALNFGAAELPESAQIYAAAYDVQGRFLGFGRVENIDAVVWAMFTQQMYELIGQGKLIVLDSETFAPVGEVGLSQ